ncbi:RNA polymerase II-associated protein 3 isoform X2 [Abrus precatorius]|uniref:RNA polymerase II-associated protein 3 isoform X2 n=1 Tax=Abrus precatorius TaxID=3816 RepID=A0A8B8MCV1_ABRPR|nr:RNA polymerase II-associated protein 3 isoform X2 [Abrus precatorius]XP_027366390.1 RNA polymerase II-associated protein 3 isoform X2 [Abrus precatorius]
MDFQGFLNDLQDWEVSRKDKARTTKSKNGSSSRHTGSVGVEKASRGDTISSGQYDFSRNNDPFNRVRSSFVHDDVPDAASEKDLGNEFFKQKKFKEAIDCYSRSIALSPTAVAYANRAMASIKLRRFQEAEDDCTEALNLDDRYIKAYSRRATARKELGKIKESMEDAEFALRLEPNNQEIKKQYVDAKSLYEKDILQKASGALRSAVQGTQKIVKSESKVNGGNIHSISHGTQKSGPAEVHHHTKVNERKIPVKESFLMEEIDSRDTKARSKTQKQEGDGSKQDLNPSNSLEQVKRNQRITTQETKASVQQLASDAASRAMAEAAKNMTPPTTAYQFEVSWKAFSGDLALQARLLKAICPHELPKIFKNALSSTMLVDIIKCLASFFTEDMDLVVSYMEHLTKVPRFDMIVMCLSSTDKDGIRKIWDEVFCSEATPMEYAEILDNLRSKFCRIQ